MDIWRRAVQVHKVSSVQNLCTLTWLSLSSSKGWSETYCSHRNIQLFFGKILVYFYKCNGVFKITYIRLDSECRAKKCYLSNSNVRWIAFTVWDSALLSLNFCFFRWKLNLLYLRKFTDKSFFIHICSNCSSLENWWFPISNHTSMLKCHLAANEIRWQKCVLLLGKCFEVGERRTREKSALFDLLLWKFSLLICAHKQSVSRKWKKFRPLPRIRN